MQYTIRRNDITDLIRQSLRMKVWNSKVSKWDADIWLPFAIGEFERRKDNPKLMQAGMIAYAINLARARGILDGTYEMALRKLTGWQLSVIIGSFCEWCFTVDEVVYTLKLNRNDIIAMAKE